MTTAVDTNILFDVLFPGSPGARDANRALVQALSRGALIICEPVYAELAAHFSKQAEIDRFLVSTGIRLVPSDDRVLYEAGAAWRRYAARRSTGLACPECGAANRPRCATCGTSLRARQHIVADFMIGAHAAARAGQLLTRDRGYYKTYFPALKLA